MSDNAASAKNPIHEPLAVPVKPAPISRTPLFEPNEDQRIAISASYDRLVDAIQQCEDLGTVQRLYVSYALTRMGGNKVHTAGRIGVDRRTIQRWTARGHLPTHRPAGAGPRKGARGLPPGIV